MIACARTCTCPYTYIHTYIHTYNQHAVAARKPTVKKPSLVQNNGNYGHLAEAILTQHRGALPPEPKGNILRGAAPPVPRLAAPTTAYGRSLQVIYTSIFVCVCVCVSDKYIHYVRMFR